MKTKTITKLLLLMAILEISLTLSCQSAPRRYNIVRSGGESSARVLVDRYLQIKAIDGNPYSTFFVNKNKPSGIFFKSGNYSIRVRYIFRWEIFRVRSEYIDLPCTFEAGKYYQIYYQQTESGEVMINYREIEPRPAEIKLFK